MSDYIMLPSPRISMRVDPWPFVEGGHATRACPVCGHWWRPWTGSRLPCHAECLFDDDAVTRIKSVRDRFRSDMELAEALGLTYGVLRGVLGMRRGTLCP